MEMVSNRLFAAVMFAMAVAATAFLAAPTPATAVPFNYTLSGASATFGTSGTDTLTGTFTYDEAAGVLDAVSIVVTGPVDPATLTIPEDIEPGFGATNQAISMSDATLTTTFEIHFSSLTNDAVIPHQPQSTPLTAVFAPPNLDTVSTEVTGEAVPTPEPPSLVLLAGALGLFLLRRRANPRRGPA